MSTTLQGHIHNGTVVFDEPIALLEGTAVRVEPVAPQAGRTKAEWDAIVAGVRELDDYDYDVVQRQRDYDLLHAEDHAL